MHPEITLDHQLKMLSRSEILKAIILHSPPAQHMPMLYHVVQLPVHGLWQAIDMTAAINGFSFTFGSTGSGSCRPQQSYLSLFPWHRGSGKFYSTTDGST